jgi:malate dehydrogenase
MAQLAAKTGKHVTDVAGLCIWGNHSATQYPDLHAATVAGKPALSLVDQAWYTGEFIPQVQQRGAAIIEARGASSAASAANAAIDHIRDWALGTGAVVSMGVYSDGSYGVEKGLIYSFPVTCTGRRLADRAGPRRSFTVSLPVRQRFRTQDAATGVNDFSRGSRCRRTEQELIEERDAVATSAAEGDPGESVTEAHHPRRFPDTV